MVANTKASKINMAIFCGLVGGCHYLRFAKFYLFYKIKAAKLHPTMRVFDLLSKNT